MTVRNERQEYSVIINKMRRKQKHILFFSKTFLEFIDKINEVNLKVFSTEIIQEPLVYQCDFEKE